MREPIKDRTRLLHILEGINNILEFKEGIDYDNFSAYLYIYKEEKNSRKYIFRPKPAGAFSYAAHKA